MVKEVKHYIKLVQEKYPQLTESEINRILTFGLRMYLWVNSMHCDLLMNNRIDEPINIYCGRLTTDKLKHYKHWIIKWRMKERALYKLAQTPWDGYYYIGLTQALHDVVMKLGKTKTFVNCFPTKVKKELYHNKIIKHIWKVPFSSDLGWRFYKEKLISDNAEYIGPGLYEKYHDTFLGKYKDEE